MLKFARHLDRNFTNVNTTGIARNYCLLTECFLHLYCRSPCIANTLRFKIVLTGALLEHTALCPHLNLIIQTNLTINLSQAKGNSHFLSDHGPVTAQTQKLHTSVHLLSMCVSRLGENVVSGRSAASCSVHGQMPLAQQCIF